MTTNRITDSDLARVRAHADREGRADYLDRADDVAAGQQDEDWAWPFVGADEAYINAVGTEAILAEIGVEGLEWEDVCDEWYKAFKRAYVKAHAEAQP